LRAGLGHRHPGCGARAALAGRAYGRRNDAGVTNTNREEAPYSCEANSGTENGPRTVACPTKGLPETTRPCAEPAAGQAWPGQRAAPVRWNGAGDASVRPRQRAQVFGVPLTAARWNLSQVEVEFLRDRS
jgi:hypothetical protein